MAKIDWQDKGPEVAEEDYRVDAVAMNAIGAEINSLSDDIDGKEDVTNKGQPSGYASLDGAGKIPAAQLANSTMEYQGTYNASTNTPSLVNGTGNTGDVYRVSVAGSRNFGAGAITFGVGDYAIYNGSIWEKSGTTNAVASVAGLAGDITASALAAALATPLGIGAKISVVVYDEDGDGLGAARPDADAVYWAGFPSTPTNAQVQDIVPGDDAPTVNDYVITVSGGTYTATGREGLTSYSGSNFTTVLQAAIDALTVPGGGVGTAGGKIHIGPGNFFFGNAVVITGWEGITGSNSIPSSQLTIEGEGYRTKLLANTSGQHGFIVKNLCSLVLKDMWGYVNTGSLSWLYGDNTGASSEMSIWGGVIDNVFVQGGSTTNAPIHLKNFFDLHVGRLTVTSSGFDCVVLENDSTTTNYGNSTFSHLRCTTSGTTKAGLKLISSNTAVMLNLMSFSNYECVGAYYGVYGLGASFMSFDFVDIEQVTYGFYLEGSNAGQIGNRCDAWSTGPSSYIQATNTAIFANANTSMLNFQGNVSGSGMVPVNDAQGFRMPSTYRLGVQLDADVDACVFSYPSHHNIRIEASQGKVFDNGFASAAYNQVTRNAQANILADAFIPGSTSTATAAGITTLTVDATEVQIFTGTLDQTLKLPTTSVTAGQRYTVVNNTTSGAGTISVQSSGANDIIAVAGGWSATFVANTTTPTTAAHWSMQLHLATGVSIASSIFSLPLRDGNANLKADAFIPGSTSTATAAGSTTLTADSTEIQVFTGSSTQTVTLPTTGIVAGQRYDICNRSTGIISLNSSAGNFVAAIPASASITVTALQAVPTAQAHWLVSMESFAWDSASASASTVALRTAQANLFADAFIPSSTAITTAAGTTALTIDSTEVQIFTGSTTQTVTLPTTSIPQGYRMTIINQSTGTVTVQSSGANTILTLAGGGGRSATFIAQQATPTSNTHWAALWHPTKDTTNSAQGNFIAERDSNGKLLASSFLSSQTSTATAAGTTVLTVSSNEVQIFTGSTTQIVTLPTTSIAAGQRYTIINLSTGLVTVNASGGTTISILGPGATVVVQANQATPTTSAHWSIVGGTAAPVDASINAQTGTTYTLVAGDDGRVVTLNNASAITVTVPQDSAAAIPIGAYIEFIQLGAGQVTFAQGTGATLNSRGAALKINAQYGIAGLRKIAANTFVLAGDTTT